MHLLFEGLDQTGKTSFINHLHLKLSQQCGILKMAVKNSEDFQDYFMRIIRIKDQHVLWDRSHISELVYSYLYRSHRYDDKYRQQIRKAEYKINKAWIVYIYTLTDSLVQLSLKEECNRDIERKQFHLELERTTLPVIMVCSQQYENDRIVWRSHQDMFYDLFEQLQGV